ncbi:MFS transporter [Neorhizobium alkalisoli]|uniref:YNFM family putative membrane transporter n=1 Tax=Neorhizobium alkalisoli TaxID=528178 RepID=A0A561QRT6_9HYPH|nr:MFS transporter [Neorhizobium alkalisoli]TWF53047.1 YNFM family putative membrane transporter [Neorhizobium alkalisoli]
MPSAAQSIAIPVETPSIEPQIEPEQPKQFLVRGTSAYRRASLAFFMSGFSTFALLYCVQPLMPIFAADFGVSPASSSLSLSLSTGFLAVAIVCAAAVSERFGRRSLMFASLLGASLCTIACAVTPGWTALLFIRALEGLLLGGVPAVAMAYLSEEIDPKGLGASMGLYIAGNAFGGMAGRVVTGILAEYFSWRLALAGIGAMGIIAAIGFLTLLPPSRNFAPRRSHMRFHVDAWLGHASRPVMALLFAIGFLLMGSFVTIYNYAGFRLVADPYHLNQTELGLIFTVYLFGIAASWAAGLLGDRFGHFTVMPVGILLALAGVLITLATPLPLIILGIVLVTSGFFMAHSVASALIGRLARGTKGHASSLYLLGYYLGSSVAGSLGGHFWSADGWWAVVAFTGAMLLAALIAAFVSKKLAKAGN